MKIEHVEGRFFAKTEHGEAELLYRIENGKVVMYHTFTPSEDRGKGIAEKLAEAAFDFVKENNFKVVPACSYIRYFLEKHKELKVYSVE